MNINIEFMDGSTEHVRNVTSVQYKDMWLVLLDREGRTIKTFSNHAIKSYTRDEF